MLDELRRRCTDALAAHGCPSVSVAVVERGEVVLAEAYGFADIAARRPATAETAYALASITKPITATAVCIAADKGLLDLDAPVPGDHAGPAPTARQLLQHRGGLAGHYDFQYRAGDSPIDADRYLRLYREPGSGFDYANLGYRWLGNLLQTAAGQSLEEFITHQVFTPLGLTTCHLGPTYPGPTQFATRYTIDNRAYPAYCDTSHPGATLGWATAAEVALFAHTHDRLMKPETAAAMRDAVPVDDHLGYGCGWFVSTDGPVIQSHSGGMGGVAAMTVAVPEQQLSVAVLSNSTSKAARNDVLDYVLGSLIPGYRTEQIIPALDVPAHRTALPAGGWAGHIITPDGPIPLRLQVFADGRAKVRLDGQNATGPTTASTAWDLGATFDVQVPTADARINSPLLWLQLRTDQGRLTGVARACKDGDGDGLLGNLLTHPCALDPR